MAKAKKRKAAPGDVASNRQASFRFELLDKLECGVVLQGTEVKALRGGAVQIKDGYAAKVEIALARGKDRFDKREAIKARDTRRDVERALRDAGR